MKTSKKKALLFMAATGNYLFAVGNVLLGLKKHSPNMFDGVVVYTDDTATEKDKTTIQKIYPVIFENYNYQIKNERDRKRLSYYSNMPYARFEMLTYLDKYEKVFWFDSDFLITDDISGLLKYGETGISMSIDLDPYPEGHGVYKFFVKNVPGYDMMARAYASGLIIFSDKLRNPLQLREYLYKQLEKYSSYIKYAEQGILQLMIEDYDLKVDVFPKLIYHAFPYEDKSNARIIHLLGPSKPWSCYTGFAYDEWYENHKKWIALGGNEAYSFIPLVAKYPNFFYGAFRYQNVLLADYIKQKSDENINKKTVQTEIKGIKTEASMLPAVLRDTLQYRQIRFKYYRYSFLSKITWGKARMHYRKKKLVYKERIRAVQRFMK